MPLTTCGPAPRREPSGSERTQTQRQIPTPSAALSLPALPSLPSFSPFTPARRLQPAGLSLSWPLIQSRHTRPTALEARPGLVRRVGPSPPPGSAPALTGTSGNTAAGERGLRCGAGRDGRVGCHDAGPADPEPCPAQGEQRARGPGPAAAVRESLPAVPGTFAGPPGGFPETFNGDSALPPNFLMQAFSYMTFFEARHPEGGFVNWLPHRLAEQWVVPYIERESPLLASGASGTRCSGPWPL